MADQATNGTPHIRTFAKDFAKLSGKNPAASPVPVIQKIEKKTVPPPPTPPIVTQAPPPAPVEEVKVPEPVIAPSPTPAPTDAARQAVLDRLRAKSGEQPAPQAVVVPSRDEILTRLRAKVTGEVSSPVSAPLHTYKSDFAERIQKTQASPLSVLAAEQDMSGRAKPRAVPLTKADRSHYVVGAALIAVAIIGTFAAYYFIYRTPLIPAAPNVPSLVFADERVEVSGAGGQLLGYIVQQTQAPLPPGQVRIMYVATSTKTDNGLLRSALPMGPLLTTLPLDMPALLSRSIEDPSTVGAISAGGETRPFFIMRVDSFERSFAGMLAWEPSMRGRLSVLFPPHTAPSATSTGALPRSTFVDEVVANHDTRVLYDEQGRVLMLYGYHDKQTLILTRNKEAFNQLTERLSTTR